MLFNSLHFLIFFLIVTPLYFSIPHKQRWVLLLIASCYFYMVFMPIYIAILGFTIVIDYFAGILLEQASGKQRKWFLIASLTANISVLAFFKYYNFLNEILTNIIYGVGYSNPIPYLTILLPVGLSFHTFQAMSYTIEVYRGNQKAERHFGIYSLYVMFYPQLVAGPIERPQNLLPQFREDHKFDYTRVTNGLKLMVWGLFMKVVIADRLASVVDPIYNSPYSYSGLSLIIATVFFSFQIFCDFAGYSNIALGAAEVMGFKLMENFKRPYHSESIHEFWGRWHISLSTWFKDYLYISLGGNRVSIPRWYFNLFIVFLISGLWHGANWTFIIWGALHGFYLVFGIISKPALANIVDKIGLTKFPRFRKILNVLTTFSLVTFAWIFFRADSVSTAFYIIKKSVSTFDLKLSSLYELDLSAYQLSICILSIIFLETIHLIQRRLRIRDWLSYQPAYIRWSVYYSIIFMILFFGVYENRQFIYFQF